MKKGDPMKKQVLFICTHNAARSQMAEGLLRSLAGDRYEVFSAGTEPGTVHPYAVRVMAEISMDISLHRSKNVDEFVGHPIDMVITVCDHAKETCPIFPGGSRKIHHSFEDPSALTWPEEAILAGFRRIRDKIRAWILDTF
jgi:arsenate reductase (thioredoxin)